jgi:hypothetical protein
MVLRSSRGRPLNAPVAFIHPCQPTVAKQPPTGQGWAHELKHDGAPRLRYRAFHLIEDFSENRNIGLAFEK